MSVVCSVCDEYLIAPDELDLSYQQRQRFFNPIYEAESYDILFLAGENFRCYHLFHRRCLNRSFEFQYFNNFEFSDGNMLLCPTSGCLSKVSSIYGIRERKYNDFIRDIPPEDELIDLINGTQGPSSEGSKEPVASDLLIGTSGSEPNISPDGTQGPSHSSEGSKDPVASGNESNISANGESEVVKEQVQPVAETLNKLGCSPPVAPCPSPTPPATSSTTMHRNFIAVKAMMRHMEIPNLLSAGWIPSAKLRKAANGVFDSQCDIVSSNPHPPSVTDEVNSNATYLEFIEDMNEHVDDDNWYDEDFQLPWISVYRVASRHIIAIFIAFVPRGLSNPNKPIYIRKKQYIF